MVDQIMPSYHRLVELGVYICSSDSFYHIFYLFSIRMELDSKAPAIDSKFAMASKSK